jgi:NAD(P)-dependent dehydrogenase (short-subunit alcohol dehydrogenase family)
MSTTSATHAIVIGGTRGIGLATARRLAEEWEHVSVIGRSEPANPGDRLRWFKADAMETAALVGALDAAAAAAGAPGAVVLALRYRGDGDAWTGEITATLAGSKAAIEWAGERMPARENAGGAIVAVTSIASTHIAAEQPVSYHMGKAALAHMVRYYAATLGKKGIRVNAVAPGTIVKDEARAFYGSHPEITGLFSEIVPLGRMGTARDVADLIAFLASSRASFITGQEIVIDGGASLLGQEALARRVKGV